MIIIPAILAGIFFWKSTELRGFSIYIFTATLFELGFTFSGVNQTKNWWLLEIFSVVEFTLVGYWILRVLSKISKLTILLFLAVADLCFIWLALNKAPDDTNNFLIHYYALFILAIVGFISFFKRHIGTSITKDGKFWVFVGITLQFSCWCIIFNLSSFLKDPKNKAESVYFSYLLSSVNIVSYTLYSIGYLCSIPKRFR